MHHALGDRRTIVVQSGRHELHGIAQDLSMLQPVVRGAYPVIGRHGLLSKRDTRTHYKTVEFRFDAASTTRR